MLLSSKIAQPEQVQGAGERKTGLHTRISSHAEMPGFAMLSVRVRDRETCIDGEASTWHSMHAPISSVLLNRDTHREEGQTDKASLGCGAMVPALGKICAGCSPLSPAAPPAQRFL